MGVHRTTSEAAKAYAERERVLGEGIMLLGTASESLRSMDRKTLEKMGNLSYGLMPYSPGYAGKLMLIVSRLFYALAGAKEGKVGLYDLKKLENEIEGLREKLL
jgi:hypothetical protein